VPQPNRFLFPALWLTWIAIWVLASRAAKPTERREPMGSWLIHVLPLMFAFWLIWKDPLPIRFLGERLFPWAPWEFWVGALVTALGLLFTIWARIHLGRNWSGTVTIKRDHELITSGPYAAVRHPIYTGLIVAIIGSALARGEWRGVLAVVIAWVALRHKLGLEERWMIERFGDQYLAYCRRVPALVPFSNWGKP
jgi:protein-S-isoprenylcysteine O-methyltransferase Ste14